MLSWASERIQHNHKDSFKLWMCCRKYSETVHHSLLWQLTWTWLPEPADSGKYSPVYRRFVSSFHPVHLHNCIREAGSIVKTNASHPSFFFAILHSGSIKVQMSRHKYSFFPSPLTSSRLSYFWSNHLFHTLVCLGLPDLPGCQTLKFLFPFPHWLFGPVPPPLSEWGQTQIEGIAPHILLEQFTVWILISLI